MGLNLNTSVAWKGRKEVILRGFGRVSVISIDVLVTRLDVVIKNI